MIDIDCIAGSEDDRLAALARIAILDTPREREYDAIVQAACRLFGVPIALVSLADARRLWLKARAGVEIDEMPRERTFCAHALGAADLMVVEDALRDPRFADSPYVVGEPHIRFYAGAPLRLALDDADEAQVAIGTLCVVDRTPRAFTAEDRAQLRGLASIVEALIRARAAATAAARLSHEVSEHALTVDRVNRQLRQAERMARIGSWRLDLRTSEVSWSEQVNAIHELPPGEHLALDRALTFYPEHERGRVEQLVQRAVRTGRPFDFESDFITAKGAVRRVHSIGEVETIDGAPAAIIGVFQDVTARYRTEQSLKQAATTDSLTGLPNRAMFEERLARLARERGGRAVPYALLLIDLDGFKDVNDTLGHHAGDAVLRAMAAKLGGEAFASTFAARLGGDEFVMLVDRPRDCASLATLAQTVLRELRHTVEDDGVARTVTATVGAALSDDVAATRRTLHQADLALYSAKRAQRGTARVFGDPRPIEAWSSCPPTLLRAAL